jgi:hypothetical protein
LSSKNRSGWLLGKNPCGTIWVDIFTPFEIGVQNLQILDQRLAP